MKEYKNTSPAFSQSIFVVETTDPAHADNINVATTQLLQNTLSNREIIISLLGWIYNEDQEVVITALAQGYSGGTMKIREGMASVTGESLVLAIDL